MVLASAEPLLRNSAIAGPVDMSSWCKVGLLRCGDTDISKLLRLMQSGGFPSDAGPCCVPDPFTGESGAAVCHY